MNFPPLSASQQAAVNRARRDVLDGHLSFYTGPDGDYADRQVAGAPDDLAQRLLADGVLRRPDGGRGRWPVNWNA